MNNRLKLKLRDVTARRRLNQYKPLAFYMSIIVLIMVNFSKLDVHVETRFGKPDTNKCFYPEEIDAVMLFVNGSDPDWQNDMRPLFKKYNISDDEIQDRFNTVGEIKYSLRSIQYFAPWIRKIHIVTKNQIPSFINASHEKINIVTHSTLFGDERKTLDSNAIQFNLHKIPDLADGFILMDDDYFFIQPTHPSDFFNCDGKPIIRANFDTFINGTDETVKYYQSIRNFSNISVSYERYYATIANTLNFLKIHQKFPENGHVQLPYLKDDLIYAMTKYNVTFQQKSEYRTFDDLQTQTFLMGVCALRKTCLFRNSLYDSLRIFRGDWKRLVKLRTGNIPWTKIIVMNSINKYGLNYLKNLFPRKAPFELGFQPSTACH